MEEVVWSIVGGEVVFLTVLRMEPISVSYCTSGELRTDMLTLDMNGSGVMGKISCVLICA